MWNSKRVLCLFLLLLTAPVAYGGDYIFEQVTDTTGEFSILGSPSMNQQREVAFKAILDSSMRGVYRSDGEVLTTIANSDGSGFAEFGPFPIVNSLGDVVFAAEMDDSSRGIFVGNGSLLRSVATTSDGFWISGYGWPSINNFGQVSFSADEGVYIESNGLLEEVVSGGADGFGCFGDFTDIDDNGRVAFIGGDGPCVAVVTWDLSIVDGENITRISQGTSNYGPQSFGLSNYGLMLFDYEAYGMEYLYLNDGFTTTELAGWWQGIFNAFGDVAINGSGAYAFTAWLADDTQCLMDGLDPVENRVICDDDNFLGKTITGIDVGRRFINDNGAIAFKASFDDLTSGIFVAIPVTFVTIDIKPGDTPNSVNPSSKQRIPVAVISTETFDATQVNWETVSFGPLEATEAHGRAHVQDVDEDGDMDMLFHFVAQDTGIACDDTEVTLVGETFNGNTISGTDTIVPVKCN